MKCNDRTLFAALVALTSSISGPTASADTITVSADDPGADFATIQEAVDAAVDGDRIEVAPGYYLATTKAGSPVVEVVGKSIEIVATAADPARTFIAGQAGRRCVEWSDAPGYCLLRGFTLDSGFSAGDGGGVLIDRAAISIEDCVFQSCTADGDGGAVHSRSETTFPPVARNCRFLSNDAGLDGGAVRAIGGFDFHQSTFEGNTAGVLGGGISFDGDPAGIDNYSIVEECVFEECIGGYGGGVHGMEATLRVTASNFSNCVAGEPGLGWGGGIGIVSGRLIMTGGSIEGCEGGQSSGGIDVERSFASCSDVSISDCSADGVAGGVYGFGAETSLVFEDCRFSGNAALSDSGGAINCNLAVSSLEMVRCTFDDNFAFTGNCVDAPNVVTAVECEFNAQETFDSPVAHVSLTGIGTGSRFTGCRFVDAETPDLASSFRATGIGGLEFIDCEFLGNRTIDVGGGLDTEGAIFIAAAPDDDSSIRFSGCRFSDNRICCWLEANSAGQGGALRVVGRKVTLADCVFDLNRAAIGGSIHAEAAVSNCVIDGSASVGSAGAAYLHGESSVVNSKISGSADCNYPAIQAAHAVSIAGCTITGSFGAPFICLVKPEDLAVCSLPGGSTVENTRFCDYTEAAISGDWVDLGGNSFNPDQCDAADLNGDGEVDGADLALVLAAWGQPCLGCATDVNGDGEVDGADLALILAGWGA